MKIAVIADCHLNKSVYRGVMDREFTNLPFRQADFVRSLRWMVDQCVDIINPDIIVFNGDIYDHFEPSIEIRGFFSSQLKRLNEKNIPVYILIGNHDVCRRHHALKDIQELGLKSISVIDKPILYDSKKYGYRFLFFPYSLDIERKNVTPKEEFERFITKVAEQKDSGLKTLFFGHFGVQGDVMNQYLQDDETDTTTTTIAVKNFVNKNPNDVSINDLDRLGAEYVFLGDFHNFHLLATKTCIGMYTGSIEKNNFSEIAQHKGFVVFDDKSEKDEKMGYCKFIEYPNCRPMLELRGNFEKIKKDFEALDKSLYQGAVAKIMFVGTSEELVPFSTGMDEFKNKVIKELNAIHIFHKQAVKDDQEEDVSDLEREIDEKGHIEATDVIEVVKEIIVERISDEAECEATIDLAIEIYKQTMESK